MWSVQINVLLNNCKHNITSLSLLVGKSTVGNIVDLNRANSYVHFKIKCCNKLHGLLIVLRKKVPPL